MIFNLQENQSYQTHGNILTKQDNDIYSRFPFSTNENERNLILNIPLRYSKKLFSQMRESYLTFASMKDYKLKFNSNVKPTKIKESYQSAQKSHCFNNVKAQGTNKGNKIAKLRRPNQSISTHEKKNNESSINIIASAPIKTINSELFSDTTFSGSSSIAPKRTSILSSNVSSTTEKISKEPVISKIDETNYQREQEETSFSYPTQVSQALTNNTSQPKFSQLNIQESSTSSFNSFSQSNFNTVSNPTFVPNLIDQPSEINR